MSDVVSALVIEVSARIIVNVLWHIDTVREFIEKSVEIFCKNSEHKRVDEMQMFIVATFTCGFDEWKSIYDGDHDLRKQFMKDDVVGKVSENCAMIKFTVTDSEKMNRVMSERIPEIAPSIGLEHEIYTLSQVE